MYTSKKKKKKKEIKNFIPLVKATRLFILFPPRMASLQQELSIFLTTNIATDQDLNLDQVKSLLDLRKQEQVKLDDKVK